MLRTILTALLLLAACSGGGSGDDTKPEEPKPIVTFQFGRGPLIYDPIGFTVAGYIPYIRFHMDPETGDRWMIDELGHEQHDDVIVRLADNSMVKIKDDCWRAAKDCYVRPTEWISFLPNNWAIHESRNPGILGWDITIGAFVPLETLANAVSVQ